MTMSKAALLCAAKHAQELTDDLKTFAVHFEGTSAPLDDLLNEISESDRNVISVAVTGGEMFFMVRVVYAGEGSSLRRVDCDNSDIIYTMKRFLAVVLECSLCPEPGERVSRHNGVIRVNGRPVVTEV